MGDRGYDRGWGVRKQKPAFWGGGVAGDFFGGGDMTGVGSLEAENGNSTPNSGKFVIKTAVLAEI